MTDVTAQSTLMVSTGTAQALHHAVSVAITAVAAGDRVLIALFGDGLGGWQAAYRGEAAWYGLVATAVSAIH